MLRLDLVHPDVVEELEKKLGQRDAECDRLADLLRQAMAILNWHRSQCRPGCYPYAHIIDAIEEEMSCG